MSKHTSSNSNNNSISSSSNDNPTIQDLMGLLKDQSKVISSLQKTIEGLNETIEGLNARFEKFEKFENGSVVSKLVNVDVVGASNVSGDVIKDVNNEVFKSIPKSTDKVVIEEVLINLESIGINVTTSSENVHSKAVHENAKPSKCLERSRSNENDNERFLECNKDNKSVQKNKTSMEGTTDSKSTTFPTTELDET